MNNATSKLTQTELAGLDFLIAKKREDPQFITDIANDVAHVAAAVVAVVAAVGAVGGGGGNEPQVAGAPIVPRDFSLEELIEARKKATGGA